MLNKRVKSVALGLIASGCMVVPSMALDSTVPVILNAEPMVLDVTVPSSLTIDVDERGVVTTADNAKIVNNSKGAVVVSDVSLNAKNSWGIVDYGTDFASVPVGSKSIAFKINDIESATDGSFVWTSQKLNGEKEGVKSELPITYDAKLPAQKEAISDLNVLDVVFTVGWYE